MPPKAYGFFPSPHHDTRVNNKKGAMWICTHKTKDAVAGHLYHFQLKEKYDLYKNPFSKEVREAIQQKEVQIYPALEHNFGLPRALQQPFNKESWFKFILTDTIELDIHDHLRNENEAIDLKNLFINHILSIELKGEIHALDTDVDFFDLMKTIKQMCLKAYADGRLNFDDINARPVKQYECLLYQNALFQQLGYSSHITDDGSLHLTLPNRRAFLTRWDAYRERHPQLGLPEIDMSNSKGIASDLEFIDAFLHHDVLLSTGREFVHDHLFHVSNLIMLIFDTNQEGLSAGDKYKQEKTRIRSLIHGAMKTLESAKINLASGGWYLGHDPSEKTNPICIHLNDVEALEMALAIITDALASYITYDKNSSHTLGDFTKRDLDNNLSALWDDELNQNLWQKRWSELKDNEPSLPQPSNLRWVWSSLKVLESVSQDITSPREEENDSRPRV